MGLNVTVHGSEQLPVIKIYHSDICHLYNTPIIVLIITLLSNIIQPKKEILSWNIKNTFTEAI